MSNFNFEVKNYSDCPRLKLNVESAANLMNTLNLSGVFSQELIGKFWLKIHNTLQIMIEKYENKNKILKHYDFSEDIKEFKAIYEPYCIFSQEFKTYIFTSYLQILLQPN